MEVPVDRTAKGEKQEEEVGAWHCWPMLQQVVLGQRIDCQQWDFRDKAKKWFNFR